MNSHMQFEKLICLTRTDEMMHRQDYVLYCGHMLKSFRWPLKLHHNLITVLIRFRVIVLGSRQLDISNMRQSC